MCQFKSALLIPRFPSTDGFDIFHRDGVDSHTALMELANINPNDNKINVAKLELVPPWGGNADNIDKWMFILDEPRRPDWLDNSMLSDAEYELRQICLRYFSKHGDCTVLNIYGNKRWYLNGKPHREDGPAIEYVRGDKYWFINGVRHRVDGPAIEYADGSKSWYLNGKRHREDGPAVEYADGCKFWWINGESLTEEEFNQR